jgi:hypothetical protein
MEFMAHLASRLYPWLVWAEYTAAGICICFFLPLAIFRGTRPTAAVGFIFSSYVFGVVLWIWSALLSYAFWGILGLIIGILIVGLGVVPIAILAAIINGAWSAVAQLVLLFLLCAGTRLFGAYLLRCLPKPA